ncbi:MAG: ABC transporter ATP-binding protein [Rhodobacteraceae bacterium]|nr:ABC transporter ATP-binding protein [Paracoccaceae bacterium]
MSLVISDLKFTYPKAKEPVLHGLNLSIRQGEIFGLLGPSGCGKSTTQQILMRLLTGYSGDISVFGKPLGQQGRGYYERIGVSFELPTLYLRMTARENLKFFASLYRTPCLDPVEALIRVDLQDAADQRVQDFSKGMKMRLNLCRSFMHNPDLLFLDEPTSGQDPARARMTRDLIVSLKEQGKTVFLTTHNMAEAAEICDRVGFLTKGHVPIIGTPADLMRQYGQSGVEVVARDGRHHAFPTDNLGQNPDFIAALNAGFLSIHSHEASLDDVFIKVTGDGA